MKGPGARWKFDVRRVWECPACARRELTGGHIVSRLCDCQLKSDPPRQTWMRLIEEGPKRPPSGAETEKAPAQQPPAE